LGLTSFGKGSVQTVIPLRGGVDGALKLTTDRYYTPSGGSIQKTGIAPDLFVAQSKRQAEAVNDQALQYTEATFHNALDAQEGRVRVLPKEIEIPTTPAGVKKIAFKDDDDDLTDAPPASPAKLSLPEQDKQDFQLQRALTVLKYGSVQAAVQMAPTAIYTKPAPKFTTAQAAPAPAGAVGPTGAHKDFVVPGSPTEKIAPSQPAPAVSMPSKRP
jgi:carboxyl-terminal processing protease